LPLTERGFRHNFIHDLRIMKDNREFFKSKNSWSEIKDRLLGCYLKLYFQKILMTHRPTYYVDCFAGQGKFEDGNPGSPLIALAVRDSCLKSTGNSNGKIELSFIELNHSTELLKNITNFDTPYNSTKVHHGRYEELIETLLQNKRGTNVFLYIDPYGIRALDYGVFKRINTYGFNSLEMLINFNSFGFFRDACRALDVTYENDEAFRDLNDIVEYAPTEINSSTQSIELLSQIAGGDYWKNIVERYKNKNISGYTAEKQLSNGYKAKLKKHFCYVLDMPIRLKPGQRPKYRMVHVSNHEDGCFHMAENMLRRKDELFTNIQQNRQPSLFDYDDTVTSSVENNIVTKDEIKKLMSAHIAHGETEVGYTNFIACFFNEHGLLCDIDILRSILIEYEDQGIIEIIRTPSKTQTGLPTKFWNEKKNQHITIRRRKS